MGQKLCTVVFTDVLKNHWALDTLHKLCLFKSVLFSDSCILEIIIKIAGIIKEEGAPPDWLQQKLEFYYDNEIFM